MIAYIVTCPGITDKLSFDQLTPVESTDSATTTAEGGMSPRVGNVPY